ncbi:MAG: DUF2235 domain-containing protein [Gammaproteobacteria bacterium]
MAKRIVICSDGTWNDPEKPNPTNVLRMARAIAAQGRGDLAQTVFYDWGVGTYYDKLAGGAFGVGLEKNVQDGYRFIVQNYAPGDEIFLFGFSRGAYTVRCLAGMLNNCGILRAVHAAEIPNAFARYKSRSSKPGSASARTFREKYAYGPERGPVKFVGVWDTVGALGIPTRALAFVAESDLFYDTEIGSNVAIARHAVAIDERREDFEPTLWQPKDGVDVRQVWFAGVHADVGGGYAPRKGKLASEIPLQWMAAEAERAGLVFQPHLLDPARRDVRAPLNESDNIFYRLRGARARTLPVDAIVHASVVARYEAGAYDSPALNTLLEAHGGYWPPIEP